jgi:ABC-type bacteriocin/lantibiotic exporter with double-glycine peptidase domain
MSIQKITIGNVSVDLRQVDQISVVKLHSALSWGVICLFAITGLLVAYFSDREIVNLSISACLIIAAIACYYFAPLAKHNTRVFYISGRALDLECLSSEDAIKVKSRLDALVRNEKG